MNFSTLEFAQGRQRSRQYVPLITQQYRLRHLSQILAFNLTSNTPSKYYFTLHSTTMCAPFRTGKPTDSPNPKWPEFDLSDDPNSSASCVVLRLWRLSNDSDSIVLTWGVHFTGLVYVGCKIADVQPVYFKENTVIFKMQGGYYTSHRFIRDDMQRKPPFLDAVNVLDTLNGMVVYRRFDIPSLASDVRSSYDIEKLRRLHSLQVQIRNKEEDVRIVREKLNNVYGLEEVSQKFESAKTSDTDRTVEGSEVRYAPQLLTMNSLNRMMQEKPTKVQRQEMSKLRREIEVARFRTRLLAQEKKTKTVSIRTLKERYATAVEDNEDRSSALTESYRSLGRDSDRLREYKRALAQHRDVYAASVAQLQRRRRALLRQLLEVYPIDGDRVRGARLPDSDALALAEPADGEVAVALGHVAHALVMCSSFLQVPLRYAVTHRGSRSSVSDEISPMVNDKERDFPLYARGKDRAQFTYAVCLLNKNIAQLRWLFGSHTADLKATLANLAGLLLGRRSSWPKREGATVGSPATGTIGSVPDPMVDRPRSEREWSEAKRCPGEVLSVPEAYLSNRMSVESFRSYASSSQATGSSFGESGGYGLPTEKGSNPELVRITNGKEIDDRSNPEPVEQGTDPLSEIRSAVSERIGIGPARSGPRPFGSSGVGSAPSRGCAVLGLGETGGKRRGSAGDRPENGGDSGSESDLMAKLHSPLTVRTDALSNVKSFNLVRK